jgi:SAM-dependent methyltransferase
MTGETTDVDPVCGWGSPVTFCDFGRGDKVLDVGCGSDIDVSLAGGKVGRSGRVIGVDLAEALSGDLPVADASVDWVVANCIISLSPDRPRVFVEIARVLKPGGQARLADIVAEGLPDWVRRGRALHNSCIRGAGSEADYLAGLRNAGLCHVAVGGRHVYDRTQLVELTFSGARAPRSGGDIVNALVGRVWSAYFSAAKPTTTKEDVK